MEKWPRDAADTQSSTRRRGRTKQYESVPARFGVQAPQERSLLVVKRPDPYARHVILSGLGFWRPPLMKDTVMFLSTAPQAPCERHCDFFGVLHRRHQHEQERYILVVKRPDPYAPRRS